MGRVGLAHSVVGGRGGEDAEGLLRGGGGAGARQRRGQAGQGDQITQCMFYLKIEDISNCRHTR